LPYGQGPLETVVAMLITKPSATGSTNAQTASDRPNLSNRSVSNSRQIDRQNNDHSNSQASNVTAGGDSSVPYHRPAAHQNQTARNNRRNNNVGRTNTHPASNPTPIPSTPNSNAISNSRRPQPNGISSGSSPTSGTNLIPRPSSFPTNQANAGSSFPKQPAPSNTGFSGKPAVQAPRFQRPPAQPPAGDRTANLASPFSTVPSGSTSKPPSSGFSVGN